MLGVFDWRAIRFSLPLELVQQSFSVTTRVTYCNSRYSSLRNPVPDSVLPSLAPQGDDELEGPFQSSDRSFCTIPEGREIVFLKGREEATVQEAKLVVPPFLESEIDDSMTVNGLTSAVEALNHPMFKETHFLGS